MAADGSNKYEPEKYHWEILNEFRGKNMKYKCLKDIEGYKFKSDDEYGFLGQYVRKCYGFHNKKINDS